MSSDSASDGEGEGGLFIEEDSSVMDAARDTVRSLRRLSQEGKLSQQARIQFMSEMIRSPGESMPERARRLLLSDTPNHERVAAWEDFAALIAVEAKRLEGSAGQGQSVASSLPDSPGCPAQ